MLGKEVQGSTAEANAGDRADISVEDAEVVPVQQSEHLVADAVPVVVDLGDERAEMSGGLEQDVYAVVESVDVGTIGSAHHGVGSDRVQSPPVDGP